MSSQPRGASDGGDDRGVSELVGVVLLFGLVTVGIGVLVISGGALQDEINDQNRLRTMEVTMAELDSRLSDLVYQQNVNLTSLDLPATEERGHMAVRPGVSNVTVSLNGRSGCSHTVEMGTVAYVDPSGAELVAEGGAIWRVPSDQTGAATPEEVVQVTQPSLQYDGTTVSMTVPSVRGQFTGSSGLAAVKDVTESVERTNETEYEMLFNTGSGVNGGQRCWRLNRTDAPEVHETNTRTGLRPLPERVRLYVNVTSPYHEAWEQHLTREFSADLQSANGEVYDRDPDDRTVGVVLYSEDVGGFDHDDDGVPNREDNCPYEYNPAQTNSEPSSAPGDDYGDECDPDDDGDGFPDDPNDPDNADIDDLSDPSITRLQPFHNYTANWTDVGPGNGDDTLGNKDGDDAEYSTDDYGPGDAPGRPNYPARHDPGQDAVPGSGRPAGDNCQKVENPDQINWDGDTVGDKCEDKTGRPDLDGDGVPQLRDNCPVKDGFNPARPDAAWVEDASDPEKLSDQPNADHDEESEDPYANTTPPAEGDACDPDDDGDGVRDPWETTAPTETPAGVPTGVEGDNCPRRANPDQRNTDWGVGSWTGRGDACDRDIDNDGFSNELGLDGPTTISRGSYSAPGLANVDHCPYLAANNATGDMNASHPGCPENWAEKDSTARIAGTSGTGDDRRDWDGDGGDDYWRNPPPAYDPSDPYDANADGNWTDDHPAGRVRLRCDSQDTPDRRPAAYPDPGDAWDMYTDPAYDRDGDGVGPCYPTPPLTYPDPGEGKVGTAALNLRVVVFELDADEE